MAYIKEIKDDKVVLDFQETGEFINVDKLVTDILELLEFMSMPEILILKNNKNLLKEKIENRFPKFVQNNFGIYDKIVSCEDISLLFEMIEGIIAIQSGKKTRDEIEQHIGNKLNKKYVHTKN